ncbi:MAG: GAF domain-containing sensor histidine kinase [Chloroflexi bacterium]|nr:GAF domain-containing sensor histidine kinase [Chloroflexota bacterium]MBI3760299.1 GAF domain-containing sensor histidine kinase [Chloroflexota bacterium]
MGQIISEKEHSREVATLARLVEVSATLNSTLDSELLLQHIIETAAELLDAEAASILLMDEQTHELRFAAATGSDPRELAKIPVPLDSSIAGAVFRDNKPLNIPDLSKDPRHFRKVGEAIKFEGHSLLGVPMRIKDRVTGVLEALNKRNGAFTDEDARTLGILASQAAVAINNARLLEELRKAYEELGKLDKTKSDFIALASHELRTPLGVILGFATILREDAQGEASDYARAVLDSAVHMRNLIEDMTNLRYLEMGRLTLTREPIDFWQVLSEARADLLQLAEAKSQALILEETNAPVRVRADKSKMILVMTNLLTNAIRFTPERGEIRLRAMVKAGEAWAQVQDNGPGVPADHLESIFEQFHQVEDHMTRRHGGLGLGLSIVRGMVELHEGRVWCDSAGPGHGSTFTIALPLA